MCMRARAPAHLCVCEKFLPKTSSCARGTAMEGGSVRPLSARAPARIAGPIDRGPPGAAAAGAPGPVTRAARDATHPVIVAAIHLRCRRRSCRSWLVRCRPRASAGRAARAAPAPGALFRARRGRRLRLGRPPLPRLGLERDRLERRVALLVGRARSLSYSAGFELILALRTPRGHRACCGPSTPSVNLCAVRGALCGLVRRSVGGRSRRRG